MADKNILLKTWGVVQWTAAIIDVLDKSHGMTVDEITDKVFSDNFEEPLLPNKPCRERTRRILLDLEHAWVRGEQLNRVADRRPDKNGKESTVELWRFEA